MIFALPNLLFLNLTLRVVTLLGMVSQLPDFSSILDWTPAGEVSSASPSQLPSHTDVLNPSKLLSSMHL
jgi:hypothetical protein